MDTNYRKQEKITALKLAPFPNSLAGTLRLYFSVAAPRSSAHGGRMLRQ